MERLELYEDFRIRAYLVRLKAWRFFPCDMSGEAFQRRKAERRRGLHRQRERERREMLHLKIVADHRNDAVMCILIKDGPMKLPKLTKRAGRCRAFEGAQGYVLRELVRRVVKRLTAWGHAEMTLRKSVYGPVYVVRSRHAKRTKSVAAKLQHPSVAATMCR